MEAKEKAKQIVNKIKEDLFKKRGVTITDEDAVLCALITVDEIINECGDRYMFSKCDYWIDVKEELDNY